MPYLRAFSSLGCPEAPLDEVVALAQRHRLDGLELRSLGGTVDLPAYFTKKFGTPAQLVAQRPALPVFVLSTSLKLVGATRAAREAFLQFVPWAEALGARWLRVFDGGAGAEAAEIAEAAATLQWWRELRGKNAWQCDVIVETHDMLFTAEKINRWLAVAPGTRLLWDTHHTWMKGGEDPVVTWRGIAPHVAHVHVKDSVNRPSARHAHTYMLPGEGEFPMGPLREVLRAEFKGCVSLEWEKMWHPYLAPVEEALTAAEKAKWW